MRIQKSSVEKYLISGIPDLDPITVICDDSGVGEGSVVIECEDRAWSYFWCAMGDRAIKEFFVGASASYLMKKLAPSIPSSVNNLDALESILKARLAACREAGKIDDGAAHDISMSIRYDFEAEPEWLHTTESNELLSTLYGEEWHESSVIPQKPNEDYVWIKSVVEAAQQGLREVQP